MSPAAIIGFALLLVGAAVFLAQLWLQLWSPETFFKLLATDGVLLALTIVGAFIVRERRASDKISNRKELD